MLEHEYQRRKRQAFFAGYLTGILLGLVFAWGLYYSVKTDSYLMGLGMIGLFMALPALIVNSMQGD